MPVASPAVRQVAEPQRPTLGRPDSFSTLTAYSLEVKKDIHKDIGPEVEAPRTERRRGRPARAENADFKPVTFHVDKEQYRLISEMADRDRRSIKQTMYLVLEAGLKALRGQDV